MRHRVNMLGTWIDKADPYEVRARLVDFVHAGRTHQIVPANVDFLRLARLDASFNAIVNAADLVVADGMPLVWAARRQGDPLPQRISGVEMILACAEVAATHSFRLFLLGAAPGVADDVAKVLQARFPGLTMAGTYAPPPLPLSEAENEKTLGLIREARADMLFVAFGAPFQERWIHTHLARLDVPVCMGVGGAFDMLAGRVRRAPLWMQRHGLEWLYRLKQEPGRLWKRYFVHDLPVFIRLMAQARQTRVSSQVMPYGRFDERRTELAVIEEPSSRVS